MELRSGYKRAEVGVIPEDWDVSALSHLCRSITDGTHFTPRYVQSGIPFYSVENITSNDFINTKSISESEHSLLIKRCKPERGDILMTRITAGILGDTKLLDWDINASIYVSLALLKPSERVDSNYLYRYSRSPAFRSDVEKRGLTNATPKKINLGEIGAIPIPVPRLLREQRAIAAALGDADTLIDSLEQLIAKKRQIKQGTVQELLSGRRRLQRFSAGWVEKTLGSLFSFSGGYSASRDQLSGKGHCYLHYGDIHQSSKSFIDLQAEYQDIPKLDVSLRKVSSASLLDEGDIVFVDASEDDDGTSKHIVVANTGKKVFISGLHTIVAKALTEELTNEYRRYCFQTEAVKKQFLFYAVGTKVSGISKTNIAKISIPVPELAEQAAIAEILIAMDAELDALESKLAIIYEIKQGMMQELLTGRIRLV
jgi:type I restriction enzyme, S subunit